MSAWNIYHKDGSKLTDVNGEQITVHGLEYSDSWMGECFLTINFKHEVPINFQIGDYIVYRGERFELNYEPGKDKQARPDTYGEGFVYDSVKFNALQDELARAEFLDVVLKDNELHYTALPKFPFYVQTLDDLLDRIQACLNEQIGAGLWKIYSRNKDRSVQRGALESEWLSVYGEKTDDNVIESMSITVDSQTCWQALALVNEKWDINFIVRGRNIYVGTTGIQANHIFKYGLGNGLYEIVQNADSDQSVVTRLRAYGSEKNLPSHYYADLGVKYVANITKVVGASTNVELELDLDYIETYFKNPRKYIVSPETGEQSSGWVLKVTFDFKTEITGYVTQGYGSKKCRFYSELKGTQTDTGDEESKEKLDAFIAQVKAGNTKMYITSGLNKKNVPSSMKEYAKNLPNNMSINRLMLPGFPHVSLSDFYNSLTNEEKKYVNPTGRQHKFSTDPHRPYIDSINIEQIGLRSASQFFETDDKTNGVIEIYPTIEEMEIGGVRVDEIDEGVAPDDDGRFGDNETVKNVDIYLKKAIDFDINDLKDDDFSISMKDGMCGGRTFKVASSTKIDGRWRLTIERVKDDALELWFPYKDYPIKKGDHFVLTGITLPDSYVNAASLKLLKYAIAFIDKNDYTRYVYQPKVDEIFMARQHDLAEKDTTGVIKSLHDTLKAGDLMEFEDTDLRIGGVISIDQLTIKEEDGKIPTYDITLREDKEVGTIQKIQQQISSLQSGNGGTGAGLTTTQVKNQVATEGSKHFISKINDDTAKGTITWEKVQKFLQGLLVGGGSWTPDAEGRSHLITDYLEVRMKAIFEELVINKTSTIGGKEIISPAGGVVAHKVEEVTVTYNNVSQKAYRCYFLAEQEGDGVDNDFAVGDQVRSESFNVRKGTYHKAGNHFYWRLVIGRDEDPVELEGKKYHYIDLSDTDCATASDVPAKGDVLNQCGNRTDVERQNCLIFSAVDTYSPSISLYHGINSYSFANREYVEYGVNKQNNKAFFNVYGDMYVGDRPTKENGYEGSSYIRYDSSTKQLSVKGKISAKSTVDGKELSQYIKENSDDTVANEAKKAAEDAQKAAQNAQKDITILGNTVTGNKKEFDNYVTNGYLEPSEIAAMAQDSKRLEDDFAAAQKSYNEVKEAEVLANTNELIDLKTAFDTLTTAKTELVTYLSDISARYNASDTNGKATIVSAVGTKFTNFQSAYASFYDKLGLANAYITRKIYGDLGVVIGDVATYQYLKKVLADGVETEINGGLILTNLIALRDPETKRVESGINGVIDKTAKGNGIATWWGGYMNDGEVVGFDKKEDYSKQAATSLVRFDGSGYMANGAIWWGTDGKVHADPTSFIISEKNLGAYLTFFEPTWKAGSAGTSVADLVSLKPNAPFTKLGVSGDATFEGTISFHGIKLTYDSTNKAIKIDGNLYATGGITAYGAGASTTGGGGGLNGSVKSYSNALKLTSESLSEIASAYSIKALDSRISSLEGGSAMDVSVSGSGNAVTAISKSGTTIIVTKGTTFLTSHQSLASYLTRTDAASLYQPKGNYLTAHQSLDGYVNEVATSGTGNAITSVSKSGKKLTFTKGATFLTSHQSLANYVTINDSRLSDSRYPKFANDTWYLVGDDAYIGDKNLSGYFCVKSANDSTRVGISLWNRAENDYANIWFNNTNINLDKQLVMNNKRIWIQGVGTAGGNNNRLTLVAGMPSGLAYNTSCRGTILYSNGIAFADPYNGNSNNDSGWIRHLETSANSGTLEIAVGDDASNEQIHFRWYNTNSSAETIAHDITVPRATGTLALTSQIPTTLPANGGNAATATKVNHSLLVFGKSFNGSADVTVADTDLIASISTGTSNVTDKTEILTSYASDNGFNDSNAKNKIHRRPASAIWGYINSKTISNADKLDNVHLNGIFTALSNTNNGVSMTIGTVAKSLANMQVYSATKLVTARNISIAGIDFVGNVNFDGTGNVSLNGAINYCTINIGDTDPNPFKRIAHIKVARSWNDNALLLYISQGYNGGNFGLCRVEFRTNDIANSDTAGGGVSIRWLIRQGYATDSIQAGYYIHLKNAYVDVFLKTTGAHQGTVIRVIQDSRGSINNSFGLINSTYNTEAYTSLSAAATALYNVAYQGTVSGIDTCTVSHANSATKLQTPRTIWGQSFDGTGNVNGTIYINNSDSENGAIILNNNVNANARISAIKDQVVFNTGAAIRFGAADWEYSDWAGLKYDTVANAIYLGIADGTVFNYYSNKRSNGTLKFPGITTITPDSGARIGGSGGDLYLGNANNSNWVKVQDICSHNGSNYWYIYQSGNAHFSNINVVGTATIGGNTTIGGNCLAKGGVTAYQSSDIRLKQDLRKLDYLGIIKAMGGTFGFAWKKDNTRSIGWIAQHVLCNPHLKDIVETDEKGYYKINYWSPKLIATAFGAIEQVGDEVSRLKARVVFLESEVQRLSGDKEDCNKKRLDNKNINSLN